MKDYKARTHLVNPEYVTLIEPVVVKNVDNWKDENLNKMWVVGNAGYGTKGILFRESMSTLKKILNQTKL